MNLFLDTSVLLAASGSATGASREIFHRRSANGWTLLTTSYVIQEVIHNIHHLPVEALDEWAALRPALAVCEDILTLDRIVIFSPAKDRPILFSALAFADVLLTLDSADFEPLMTRPFYGLTIKRPGTFLNEMRAAQTLR